MRPRRRTPIIVAYVLSLAATIAVLVFWVVYVVRGEEGATRWGLLFLGFVLALLVIGGVTYQLGLALASRRYALKQDEFVSNVTHEMKSPLAAIKLHAQNLLEDETTPVRRSSLEHIVRQADRMGVLVDNVLESSRLLAGKSRLQLRPLAVAAFFARYLPEAQRVAEGRGARLDVEVASAAWVIADEEGMRRVMDNLIDNAARFSERGGEVRCRVRDEQATVSIVVEDDGVGIPPKELAAIFDRFYQASSGEPGDATRRGTGLGLSIVAGLVREMGGTVRAESGDGRRGTRFVVALPRGEASA